MCLCQHFISIFQVKIICMRFSWQDEHFIISCKDVDNTLEKDAIRILEVQVSFFVRPYQEIRIVDEKV